MARPKKQTVEYFPHYVNSGKTMFILESNFANDGYAFWFKVLELLGMTDGHVYDCRNTADWEFLLAKTHVSEDIASRILQKLADLDAIDAELWKDRLIWSDNFVKNLLPLYNNRRSNLPEKPISTSRNPAGKEFLQAETHDREITTGKNTQSKVKESKVKESKVEKEENSLSSNKAFELCNYYETLKPGLSISSEYSTLMIWINDYTYGWVKEAMEMCIRSKDKFIKPWIEKVLKNWATEGKGDKVNISNKNVQTGLDMVKKLQEEEEREGIT